MSTFKINKRPGIRWVSRSISFLSVSSCSIHFILFVAMAAPLAFDARSATILSVTLPANPDQLEIDTTIDITVNVDSPDLQLLGFKLNFDESILEFVDGSFTPASSGVETGDFGDIILPGDPGSQDSGQIIFLSDCGTFTTCISDRNLGADLLFSFKLVTIDSGQSSIALSSISAFNTQNMEEATQGPNPNDTVTIVDNTPPTASCQDVTVQLDGAGSGSVSGPSVDNGSTDRFGIQSLSLAPSSFTCANVGTNAVTLTVTDSNSNTSSCTASVTVEDTVEPVGTCQAATVQLTSAGGVMISPDDVNVGQTCDLSILVVSPSNFTCANIGTNTVTLTVTDNSSNTSSCTASVAIQDNVEPTSLCNNVTVQLNAAGTASLSTPAVDAGSTDACGISSVTVSPSSFTCANVGTNSVTLTVTDSNSNTSSCTGSVTVQDTTVPTATCQDATVQLSTAGSAALDSTTVNAGSTDACGISSVTLSPSSFTCVNVGTNTVTLTVTDSNTNTSNCTSAVTVEDNVNPEPMCQAVTIQLDSAGNGIVGAGEVNNGSTDACGVTLSVLPLSFTCANVGTNQVTLTVTDNNNNTSSCTGAVTVEDNVAPTSLCKDVTVQLDASGDATISTTEIDATSTDACGISSVTLSPSNFTCVNVGTNTVTLTVTDSFSNTSSCTGSVTVQDNVDPTSLCNNVTVQLDGAGTVSLNASSIDVGSTDACGISSVTLSPSSFTCVNVGTNSVTLTVTDSFSNTSSCTGAVTVEDNVAPTSLCKDVTVQLDASGDATISTTEIDATSTDACGISSVTLSPSSFTCVNVGTNTVTLTVTDSNTNTSNCTSAVTVEDNIDPEPMCQAVTIQLDSSGNGIVDAGEVNNGSTDACGVTLSVLPLSFTCANVGTNQVTLTVTDNNNNTASCTGAVTVEDNVAPTSLCKNVTVQLDASGDATISTTEIDATLTDACGISSVTLSPSSFTCVNVGTNTVTLTVTDSFSNTSSCTASVTAQDIVVPTALCQAITIQLDSTGSATISGANVDAGSTDACGIASLAVTPSSFACADAGTDHVVLLTVVDENGNIGECSTTVHVEGWSIDLDLSAGWNLISFPGRPFRFDFLDAIIGSVWGWDMNSLSAVTRGQISGNHGYWMYTRLDPESVVVCGRTVDSSASLVDGWNLIGVVSDTPIDMLSQAYTIRKPVWRWSGDQFIPESDVLRSIVGYWVFAVPLPGN